jgi:hypothetical protein
MKFKMGFCLLLVFNYCLGQKITPGLRLTIGETYYLTSEGTSTTLQVINGRENKIVTSLVVRLAFIPLSLNDSVYSLRGSYKSINIKISTSDTTLRMSSASVLKPDTPSVILSKMIDKPVAVAISKTGRVKSVSGVGVLLTQAVNDFAGLDSAKRRSIAAQLDRLIGDGMVTGLLQSGLSIFPGRAVAQHSTWRNSTVIFSPAKMTAETNYRLFSDAGDVYEVHGDGDLATDTLTAKGEVEGMPVTYRLAGASLSDIKIDKKTGWVVEIHQKQLINGEMDILKNPRLPDGMTIPMVFNTEIAITGK